MVKVKSITLDPATKTADVFLMADTKEEINNLDPKDVVGMPPGYTFAPFSNAMTAKKELAILKSDGQWQW